MANLTVTVCRLVRATESEILTRPVGESAAEGAYMRQNATTGYLEKGNATSTTEIGGIGGLLIDDAATAGLTSTIALPGAVVDLGSALDGLAPGASVFLSDDDATLADAAGTVSRVIGVVEFEFGSTGGDRVLRLGIVGS